MFGSKVKILICVAMFAVLSACADNPKKVVEVQASPNLENMLAQASEASKTGQSEKALSVLKSAASAFPADKKPWLQMAQINFDSSNYGDAITNALEVLHRDAADRVASSIVAVSGLRLSTKALADLSRQNNLSGTVRTEAQDLAKLLRDSLGEAVLVPAAGKGAPAKKLSSFAGGSGVARTSASRGEVSVNKPVAVENKKADANPFSSLK
ncbi:hypothetical protein BH11PSE12_BH11PSE12_29960 [soil metagenome]